MIINVASKIEKYADKHRIININYNLGSYVTQKWI